MQRCQRSAQITAAVFVLTQSLRVCARAGTKYCMLAVSTKEPMKKFWNWTQEHNMGNEPNNSMENRGLTEIA